MVMKMKIFFLHSKRDYKTEQEKLWIDIIRKCYPEANIINSSDINDKIDDNDRVNGMKHIEEKYFFPIIDISDIIIVVPSFDLKRFTIGVVVEMKYAMLKGKTIKLIDGQHIKEIDNIEKYEKDVAYHIPGEEPIIIGDLIKFKGFKF